MSFTAENAQIILQQLTLAKNPTAALKMFVGAKNFGFCSDGQYVRFYMEATCKKISGKFPRFVKITLDPSDTYTIEFGAERKFKNDYGLYSKEYQKLEEVSGIYCDSLKSIFEEKTGLYLSLN